MSGPVIVALAGLAGLLFARKAAADSGEPAPDLLPTPATPPDLPGNRTVTDVSGQKVPRGIRNNNPGNLEGSTAWDGLDTPRTDGVYLRFIDASYGLRALAINLLNQQRRYYLSTIREIITKFAPPSENDTATYIDDVSNATGVDADQPIDLESNPDVFLNFLKAIITRENGQQPYADTEIDAAIQAAIEHT